MIKAGEETFIFDVGNKSIDNLRNWRVPLNQLNSIFISHLHSDHIAELPEIHMWNWIGTGLFLSNSTYVFQEVQRYDQSEDEK